jgi:hypothetical protein
LEGSERYSPDRNARLQTKLTDTQLRQVSQLLAHANEITDSVKQVLVTDAVTPAPPSAALNTKGK